MGLEGICDDPPDPADVADADAYKELIRNNTITINPDQTTVGEALDLTEQDDQTGAVDHANLTPPQGMSTLVIDQFPFSSLGMPIPNKPQGASVYESWRATSMDSLWAPFCSKLD